jgi:hypothetical protein
VMEELCGTEGEPEPPAPTDASVLDLVALLGVTAP